MTTSSPTLAGPPGDCCFTGVKHSGTPAGKSVTIAGVPTYVSETRAEGRPKKIVLFFADVYGPFFLNNQLLQDYFAENGYLVLGIDYFFGDAVYLHTEPDFDRKAWIDKNIKAAKEVVPKWLHAIYEMHGSGADTKYCSVGYCFGGPFALDLATTNNIVASAFAHPAFLNEDHFTQVTKPLFMSCAETDHTFPLESRRRAEDLLIAAKANYNIQVFSGVAHGFSSRGDPAIENERWAKEESARGIVGWFNRFSTSKSSHL